MSKAEPQYKPVTVDKPIPVNFDLGNLATFDPNPVETSQLEQNKEQYLADLNRDNVQLMINQILSLPIKTTTESANGKDSSLTLVRLPAPTTDLPREKPLPKPKPLTKWEQFAIKKGIHKTKSHDKKMFDEEKGEWVNKWGYKGKNKELDDQWLVEVDEKHVGTDKELIDPRSLARGERKKLIKKNLAQQKRNLRNAE
ncbi:Rrs1 protein [Saccharomycopsis crataegensis]|uniref:Ribosome biogenesis regulatory protein n=1 Tax=Saccharomycopsis crataegensis TaxID=43959 RepID=A0AAV5QKG1_9ASCO|nr:Rrs1 protein [Saccharomycopsis crataegensis]